ncbi:hypothetical protein BHE74_00001355 [Ensete ventricosum]|nr:hypothetical protein GW17_00004961 [Ensete ventricosum]RWW89643.1 hypothetical protein BHE74_00001355 [Ensete ventricosum]
MSWSSDQRGRAPPVGTTFPVAEPGFITRGPTSAYDFLHPIRSAVLCFSPATREKESTAVVSPPVFSSYPWTAAVFSPS